MIELEKENLTPEDCMKTAMLMLEILSSKGLDFEQQLLVTANMLQILKFSHPNQEEFKKLESDCSEKAYKEVLNICDPK